MRGIAGAAVCLLLLAASPAGTLHGQGTLTLAETARWLESDGTEMATSSSDTSLTNVRMVSLTSKAALQLAECRLKPHSFHGEWNYELHPRC